MGAVIGGLCGEPVMNNGDQDWVVSREAHFGTVAPGVIFDAYLVCIGLEGRQPGMSSPWIAAGSPNSPRVNAAASSRKCC